MTGFALGVDIGGGGVRARLVPVSPAIGPDSAPGAPVDVPPGPPLAVGRDGVSLAACLASIAEPVLAAAAERGGPLVSVAVGMSGILTLGRPLDTELVAVAARFGDVPRCVASDAVTALVGALGLGGGAVLAAGTGAVALGTDMAGVWQRVDGWGHVLGDLGSGSWIGAEALRLALKAADGRRHDDGARRLLRAAEARLGPAFTWPRQIYGREDRAAVLASLVPDVAGAALTGDPTAVAILAQAGRQLAETLAGALVPSVPQRATAVGGLFGAREHLLGAFRTSFRQRLPEVELVDAAGGPLDGACALAVELAGGGVRLPRTEASRAFLAWSAPAQR